MKNGSNDHEVRITRLEVVVENINTTLVDIKRSLERLEDKMDSKFLSVENKFSELNKKIDTERAWIIGIGFTTMLSFFGTVVMIIMKFHS
jgi:uncharacterized coiled-coil protein SlyX